MPYLRAWNLRLARGQDTRELVGNSLFNLSVNSDGRLNKFSGKFNHKIHHFVKVRLTNRYT